MFLLQYFLTIFIINKSWIILFNVYINFRMSGGDGDHGRRLNLRRTLSSASSSSSTSTSYRRALREAAAAAAAGADADDVIFGAEIQVN